MYLKSTQCLLGLFYVFIDNDSSVIHRYYIYEKKPFLFNLKLYFERDNWCAKILPTLQSFKILFVGI